MLGTRRVRLRLLVGRFPLLVQSALTPSGPLPNRSKAPLAHVKSFQSADSHVVHTQPTTRTISRSYPPPLARTLP
ncbi:hypothetical protein Q5752_002408 [Cryptotrichosporon argae]